MWSPCGMGGTYIEHAKLKNEMVCFLDKMMRDVASGPYDFQFYLERTIDNFYFYIGIFLGCSKQCARSPPTVIEMNLFFVSSCRRPKLLAKLKISIMLFVLQLSSF